MELLHIWTTFGGWTVDSGSVELNGTGVQSSPLGGRSIDLNGTTTGAISQTLTTVAGRQYQVIFAMSGNFGGGEATKDLRVSAAGQSQDFSISQPTGWSASNMLWSNRSMQFTAGATSTNLSFASLDGSNAFGAVIADVKVIEIPAAVQKVLSDDPSLTYDAATGKFYRTVNTSVTWATAQSSAISASLNGVSGELATIGSAYENDLVWNLNSNSAAVSGLWLGASDSATEGTWKWYSGTTAGSTYWVGTSTGTLQAGQYANWASGEPNDSGGAEDWAYQDRTTGLWNDSTSTATTGYIIQWDASEVLSNYTYTLTSNPSGAFAINGSTGEITVSSASPLDEIATDPSITVQVTDGFGNTYSEALTIAVNRVNDNAPIITSNGGGATASINVAEGTTAVTNITATDADLPSQTLTYSIVGGADSSFFSISSSTGALSFVTARNFETPADTGGNNVYDIIVRVDDGTLWDDQSIAVSITNVNETPTAVIDTATAVEAGGTSNGTAGTNPAGNVLTNDTDIDSSDTKTVSGVAAGIQASTSGSVATSVTGSYGSINIAANGAYTYTVDNSNPTVQALRTSGNTLTDVFTYTMQDSGGMTSTTQITVTIQGANDAPVAVTDNATAIEAGGVSNGTAGTNPTGNVLTNDSDVDSGDGKTVSGVAAGTVGSASGSVAFAVTGSYGSISIASNGAYTYTVDNSNATLQALRTSGQTITDVFTYTVTDTGGLTSSTQITVTIQGANDAPTSVSDTATAVEAGGISNGTAGTNPTGNLLTNDTDPDSSGNGETKTVVGVLAGTQASATGNVASSVIGNYGSINVTSTGNYTYTVDNSNSTVQSLRNSSNTLTDVFTYTMNDASGVASTTQITITIQGANDTPTAVSDSATAVEAGGTSNGAAGTNPTGNVLTNDTDIDSGDSKTVSGVVAGTVGSATGSVATSVTGAYGSINIASNGAYTYTVDNSNSTVQSLRTSGSTITDVFTYSMTDTAGATSTTQITVTIQGANDAPVAVTDNTTAVEAGGVSNGTTGTNPTGNVLTNDTDVDSGDGKTVSGVAAGTVGSASGAVATSVTGSFGSINIASNGVYTYTVDNSNATVQALRNNGQTITDVFTYTVSDSGGLTSSTQITVTIQGANDAPASVSDTATAVEAGGVSNGTAGTNPTGNVLTNDTEPDSAGNGETKTVVGVLAGTQASAAGNVASSVSGSYGSINITSTGSYTYTVDNSNSSVQALRNSSNTLTDVFTYTMNDASGVASTTQITITIQGSNDTPTAVSDTATAVEAGGTSNGSAGTNPTGNVLSNDTDVDSGDTKTVSGVAVGSVGSASGSVAIAVTGSYGSISIASNGAYTYSVDNSNATVQALRTSGDTITDVFTYTMTDTAGATSTTQITFTIQGANDSPIVSGIEGSPLFYSENSGSLAITSALVLADVDDANLSSAIVQITGNYVSGQDLLTFTNQNGISGSWDTMSGTLTLTGAASKTNYEAALRSVGYSNNSEIPSEATRTVSYTVNDGALQSASASRDISINSINDAPINITAGTLFTGVNNTLTMSGANAIQVSDVDAASSSIRVSLTASHGTITLSGTSGITFSTGDGTSDGTIVMTGSLASINAALDGMQFIPTNGYTGSASISMLTEDLGNTGVGGNLSDSDVIAIQVGGVRFQQGDNGYTGTQDTYVSSSATSTAYGNATSVLVDDPSQHGLIRFDNVFGSNAGQIAYGSTITSASLSIYVTGTDNLDLVNVHRMLSSWTEASTWNSLTSGIQANNVEAATTISYTLDAGVGGWITITGLTSTVQAWSDGATNYGWAMLGDGADNWTFHSSEFATVSLRPYLTVAFSTPQSADVDLDANNSSGASGSGFDRTWTENAGAVAIADLDATISDADSSNLQSMTISISNLQDGTAELLAANTSGTSITASYNSALGTLTLSGSDSVAHYQQVLRTVSYNNTSESPSTIDRLITVQSADAYVSSNLATATIHIQGVNDAPVLDAAGSMSLTSITEDDIANSGNSVASIIASAGGDRISDVDAGAVEGMAITSISSGSGTWQYSINGGGSWNDIGSVDSTSALLLRGSDQLRFVPNSSNGTTADITFRAWDQTSGVAGTKVDSSSSGGTTAFSLTTEIASIVVTSVNDNPVGNIDSATAVEDGGLNNSILGTNPSGNVLSNDTDVDTGDTKTVTGVAAGVFASTSGSVAASVTGSYGSIHIASNGAYTYTVDNGNASVQALRISGQTITDVFSYTVTDAGGLTSTAQITVTIQGANDAPTSVVDNTIAVEAGGTANGNAGTDPTGNVLTNDTDPDSAGNGETKTVVGVLAGTQSSAFGNVASSVTGSFGSISIAANGSYSYTVNNSNASVQALRNTSQTLDDVFTYTITDIAGVASTTQITVTIQGANDAPTAVFDSNTAVEAGGVSNGNAGTNPTGNVLTNDTDPDSIGNGETKSIVGVIAGTQASASGSVASSVNGSYGSISIAANGAYTYTVDNNNATVQGLRLSGQTITDIFTYTMADAAGIASTTQITITIQGANDAPAAVVDNVSATEAGGHANGTVGSNPTGNVLTNDIDPDSVPNGETRTITGVAVGVVGSASTNVGSSLLGSYGSITIAANGAYTYTVDNNNSTVQALRSSSDTIDDVFSYTMVDASGVSSTSQVTVTIQGANDTPTVSSLSTASILENTTAVITVVGQDVDASTTFVYSISGGADAAKFSIDSSTGALSLINPADFENPTDTGGNNVYDVDVQISDGALTTTQSIAITILDVSNLLYVTTANDNNDSGIATGASFNIEWLNAHMGADGLVSLREAIIASNNTVGTDTIRFAISGTGVHIINVASALPSITDTTILDATTDDSFAANSNLPAIILDGNNLNASGLTLSATADGSTIQGFVIRDFGQNGIHILSGSDSNTIVGNFIGALTATGADAGITEANGVAGIRIEGSNNLVGGLSATNFNIIAGNGSGGGVIVFGSGAGNSILGNHIYGNGGIAIDLGGDGLTSNDGVTSAGQPNLLVDTPIISNANLVGNNLSLSGYIGSAANQAAFANSRVEFYKTTTTSSVLLGTLTSDASGNFIGTLDVTGLGLNQSDSIIATATNPAGNTSEFSVSFEANATPTAVSDAEDAIEAGGLSNGTAGTNPTGNVLSNDTDPNTTDTKSVSGVAAGTVGSASGAVGTSVTGNYGSIQIASNGTYAYTVDNSNTFVQALRNNGQTLTDVFTYTMQDSGGLSSTAQITITVHGANDTPTAVNDSNVAVEASGVSNATAGSNASGNVLTNDTDVDTVVNGETKAVSGVAAGVLSSTSGSVASTVTGAYGSITIASSGSYTYTIDNSNASVQALRLSSQTLEDVFSYTVTDAGGLTSTTQITITIQGANDAPTAVIDNAIAVEAGGASNGTAGTNPIGSVFANDIDPDSVSNGETMTVTGVAAGSTPSLGSVGSSITGTYGSIVISAGGTYSYTVDNTNALVQALRNTSQTLQDVFTYSMVDALGLASDTQITITIQGANDTPTAVGETANAVEAGGYSNGTAGTNPSGNVLTNDTDPDSLANGETKAVTGVASGVVGSASGSVASSVTGTYGSITIAANGSYTYVVDNGNSTVQALRTSGDSLDDVFTYTMTDAGGLTSSTQITVHITGSNDAPSAQNDNGIAVEAGGISNATLGSDPTGNILSNDSDIDNGDSRSVVGVAAGAQVSASGQVAITVAGTYGTITIASNGSYSYAVDNSNNSVQALRTATDTLDDVFTYTIEDAAGLSSTAYVTITIQGQNDAPIAVNDSAIAVEAGGVSNGTAGTNPTGNVLSNDTDVDSGDSKTVVGVVAGTSSSPVGSVASTVIGMYGSLVLQSDGSYAYTVDNANSSVQALRTSGQTLSEVFTYSMQDSAGSASIATLTLTIQGSNDAPVAVGNTANALEASGVANNISGTDPTGNVLTNDTDVDAGDSKAVFGVAAGVQLSTSGNVGSSIAGNYGSLVLNSNGTYTYTVDNNNATVEALNAGQSLTETFLIRLSIRPVQLRRQPWWLRLTVPMIFRSPLWILIPVSKRVD